MRGFKCLPTFNELIKRYYINLLYNWTVTGTSRTGSRDLFTKCWDRRQSLLFIDVMMPWRALVPRKVSHELCNNYKRVFERDLTVRPEDSDRFNTKLGLKFRKLYLYLDN